MCIRDRDADAGKGAREAVEPQGERAHVQRLRPGEAEGGADPCLLYTSLPASKRESVRRSCTIFVMRSDSFKMTPRKRWRVSSGTSGSPSSVSA